MDHNTVVFLILFIIDFVFTFIAAALFLKRCYLLNRMANQKNQRIPKSFIVKSSLLALFVLSEIIELILSQTSSSFWLATFPEPALILIFPILAICVQEYLIYLEYKKRERPTRWHRAYWLYQLLVTITMTVLVFVLKLNSSAVTLPIVKIIAMLGLLVYTTFIEQPYFEMEVSLASNTPNILAESSVRPKLTQLTNLDKIIYIEFNSVPSIHYTDQVEYEFNIAVYLDNVNPPNLINKFEKDFHKLQKEMEKVLHHSEDIAIPKIQPNRYSSHIAEGEQKVKMYEEYLIKLTKSSDYYVEPLLDFLEIAGDERIRLLQMNKRGAMELSFSINQIQPSLSINQRRFFSLVEYRGGLIKLTNQEGTIKIEEIKSVKELENYQEKQMKKGKLKSKLLISGTMLQCMSLIDHFANNSKYWMQFSIWIGVSRPLQIKIYRMIEWFNFGFSNSLIKSKGYELVAKSQGQTITMYNFQLNTQRQNTKIVRIKKRFNDFVKINDQLIQYFKSKKMFGIIKMPSLPPKVAAFGSKTSPESRQKLLETYLTKLLSIEGINYSSLFLEFLQPANPEEGIVLYAPTSNQDQGKLEDISVDQVNQADGPSVDLDSLAMSQLR